MGISSSKSSSSTPLPSTTGIVAGFLRPVTVFKPAAIETIAGKAKEPSNNTNAEANKSHTIRVETLKNEMM